MPDLAIEDISKLAFPKGVREKYTVLAWTNQRRYFLLLIILGCLLFMWGLFA